MNRCERRHLLQLVASDTSLAWIVQLRNKMLRVFLHRIKRLQFLFECLRMEIYNAYEAAVDVFLDCLSKQNSEPSPGL